MVREWPADIVDARAGQPGLAVVQDPLGFGLRGLHHVGERSAGERPEAQLLADFLDVDVVHELAHGGGRH